MRLTPVDRPPTLLARLLFFAMRRTFGRVPTPYRVVFARLPQALLAHALVVWVLDRRLRLDPGLRLLCSTHVAALNDCTFCVDIGRAVAVRRRLPLDKVRALADYRHDPRFDARERAALAYVEEIARSRRVADATFATLQTHFTEREIVEMTWLVAVEHYFNTINLPLGIGSDGLCAVGDAGAPERRAS
jgi:alkylhydroperoxidase family enzyme